MNMEGSGTNNSAATLSEFRAAQLAHKKETSVSDHSQNPNRPSEEWASMATKHAATLKRAQDMMTKATELNELIPPSHRSSSSAEKKNMYDVLDKAVKYLK